MQRGGVEPGTTMGDDEHQLKGAPHDVEARFIKRLADPAHSPTDECDCEECEYDRGPCRGCLKAAYSRLQQIHLRWLQELGLQNNQIEAGETEPDRIKPEDKVPQAKPTENMEDTCCLLTITYPERIHSQRPPLRNPPHPETLPQVTVVQCIAMTNNHGQDNAEATASVFFLQGDPRNTDGRIPGSMTQDHTTASVAAKTAPVGRPLVIYSNDTTTRYKLLNQIERLEDSDFYGVKSPEVNHDEYGSCLVPLLS
ncbi:hypothetical protein PM082_014999 [Marasmius tenuissimus]|nr:hypothetical protein PM082_014999 [Marasmius tenuissimus]